MTNAGNLFIEATACLQDIAFHDEHSVEERIVSIHQPHLMLMVRGKANTFNNVTRLNKYFERRFTSCNFTNHISIMRTASSTKMESQRDEAGNPKSFWLQLLPFD